MKKILKQSTVKTCKFDPLPTSLLTNCLDDLLPRLASIINDYLHSGLLPSAFKSGIVKPLPKKTALNREILRKTGKKTTNQPQTFFPCPKSSRKLSWASSRTIHWPTIYSTIYLKDWMTNNKLQLKEDKTDMIPILPRKVLNNVPFPSENHLNGSNIKLSQTVHNLGITLDQTLSFQQHYFKLLPYLLSWAPPNQHNPSLPSWRSHINSNVRVRTI